LREGLHGAHIKTAEAIDEITALLNNWLLGWRKVNGSFTNSVYMQIAKQLLKHNDHLHIFMRADQFHDLHCGTSFCNEILNHHDWHSMSMRSLSAL